VSDHQIAHVYVAKPELIEDVRRIIASLPGVERVLDRAEQRALAIDHARSGELVALARSDAWFTYYYWLDDRRMPDFARTVDIHRKPGYDPVELFIDPKLKAAKLKIASTLLRRKLGFRSLLEVIPTDASLVRGSHGRPPAKPDQGPLILTQTAALLPASQIAPTEIFHTILRHLTDPI